MSEKPFNGKKVSIAMILLYFTIWGMQFISMNYISVYVSKLPFSNSMIVGLIVALGALTTCFAQLFWGMIADRSRSKNRILSIAILGAASAMWLLILPSYHSLIAFLPCVVVLYFFLSIPPMLSDTLIVENVGKTGSRFGFIKSFSSLGAAAMAFLLFVISLFSEIQTKFVFILSSCAALLSLIPLQFIPQTKGHAYGEKQKGNTDFKRLLKNKSFVLLLCFGLSFFVCMTSTNTFLSVYYSTDQGLNAGLGLFGLYNAIGIAAESAIMILANKWINKLSIYNALLLTALSGCVRSLVVFLAPNPYIMMINAVFHGLTYGPLWVRIAPHIQSIVPPELRTTGQALWSIMVYGAGPIIGSLLSGVLVDLFGIRNLFLFNFGLGGVVFIVFFFLFRRQSALENSAH